MKYPSTWPWRRSRVVPGPVPAIEPAPITEELVYEDRMDRVFLRSDGSARVEAGEISAHLSSQVCAALALARFEQACPVVLKHHKK